MAAPEMTSTRTWGTFFDPCCGGGAKWRPFRFRPPSWMTSFAGTGNEVIQDGGRKRKGRHLAPPPQWGSKKVPYTTKPDINLHIWSLIADLFCWVMHSVSTKYIVTEHNWIIEHYIKELKCNRYFQPRWINAYLVGVSDIRMANTDVLW